MRSNFVLVSFYIGIATGTGSPIDLKISQSSGATNKFKDIATNEVVSFSNHAGSLKELPINRTNIDEIDLYEHASAKQNNQSERAFIYIKQKYRKPGAHRYFSLGNNGFKRFSAFNAVPELVHRGLRNEPAFGDLSAMDNGNTRDGVMKKGISVRAAQYMNSPDMEYNNLNNTPKSEETI